MTRSASPTPATAQSHRRGLVLIGAVLTLVGSRYLKHREALGRGVKLGQFLHYYHRQNNHNITAKSIVPNYGTRRAIQMPTALPKISFWTNWVASAPRLGNLYRPSNFHLDRRKKLFLA